VKLRIVERSGELGLERIRGTGWNPTSEIWRQAWDDIHRLLLADQCTRPWWVVARGGH
jgi:hypothetical protein